MISVLTRSVRVKINRAGSALRVRQALFDRNLFLSGALFTLASLHQMLI